MIPCLVLACLVAVAEPVPGNPYPPGRPPLPEVPTDPVAPVVQEKWFADPAAEFPRIPAPCQIERVPRAVDPSIVEGAEMQGIKPDVTTYARMKQALRGRRQLFGYGAAALVVLAMLWWLWRILKAHARTHA